MAFTLVRGRSPTDPETLSALATLGQGANALQRLHGDGGSRDADEARRSEAIEPAVAGCRERFRLRVAGEEAFPAVARLLVERGVALYEMRLARKSLEALFLEVMGEDQRPG